jgi:hypothetical protein
VVADSRRILDGVADRVEFDPGRSERSLPQILVEERKELIAEPLAKGVVILCEEVGVAGDQIQRLVWRVLDEEVEKAPKDLGGIQQALLSIALASGIRVTNANRRRTARSIPAMLRSAVFIVSRTNKLVGRRREVWPVTGCGNETARVSTSPASNS